MAEDIFTRLEKLGAIRAKIAETRRLFLNVEAVEKKGKSHFGLTAPGPLVYIDLDNRAEGTIEKFLREDKEVIHLKVEIPKEEASLIPTGIKGKTATIPPDLLKVYKKARQNVRDVWKTSLDSGARTIVVDTADEWWELERNAEFGQLEKVPPNRYVGLNSQFEAILRTVLSSQKTNVILINRMKDEWKNSKNEMGSMTGSKTGRKISAGYKNLGFLTQATLEFNYDEKEQVFQAKVKACGFNPIWTGYTFEEEELGDGTVSFPYIAACLTSDTRDIDEGLIMGLMDREKWEV